MTIQNRTVVERLMRSGGTGTPIGIYISSIDPCTSEIAGQAGFDFTLIDGEHSPFDRLTILNHVRAAQSRGIVPLARGQDSSNITIQGLLDVGAAGVVLPKIETADEARRAVAATRYAPSGTRGMCPGCHDGSYSVQGFSEHMARRNRDVMAIPIIETRKGVENIEEIVAVEGMDLIHFGPGDLSADMGIDLATEPHKLTEAWIHVRDATKAAGKYILVPDGFGFEGADAYIVPMDLIQLHTTFRHVVSEFRSRIR